jgi:hypothetical protein
MIEEQDEHDLNQSNHDEDDINYWEEETINDGIHNPSEQEHKEEEEETEATSGLWTADHEEMYDAAFSTTNNVADISQRDESPSIQQDVIKMKKPIEKQLREDEDEEEEEGIELPREKFFLYDLDKPGSYVVVARGGRSGIGNEMDAQRQFSREVLRNSMLRAQSSPGESVFLELELKLILALSCNEPCSAKNSALPLYGSSSTRWHHRIQRWIPCGRSRYSRAHTRCSCWTRERI